MARFRLPSLCVIAFSLTMLACLNPHGTIAVKGVSLNSSTLDLVVGGAAATLSATIAPADATNQDVTWTSSAQLIASVDSSGIVTPLAAGTATITVTTADGKKTANCEVSVVLPSNAPAVKSIGLSSAAIPLLVAETASIAATITPSDANAALTWTSSDEGVASVSSSGVVTAKALGHAVITATSVANPSISAASTAYVLANDDVLARTDILLDATKSTIRTTENDMGHLVAASMLYTTGADIALINAGGIRVSVPAGNDITRKNAYEILPFLNLIQTTTILGSEIRAIIENGVSLLPAADGRFPQLAGLTYDLDTAQPVGSRVSNIMVGGVAVDPAKSYTLAADDYVMKGGDGYSMLAGKTCVDYPLQATAFAEYLRVLGTIPAPQATGRIALSCWNDRYFDASLPEPYNLATGSLVTIKPAIGGKELFYTDDNGALFLGNVPPGDYTVSALFNEKNGSHTLHVVAGKDSTTHLGFMGATLLFVYARTTVTSPPLSDKAFRAALSKGIDRDALATAMHNANSVSYTATGTFIADYGSADPVPGLTQAATDITSAQSYFNGNNYSLKLLYSNAKPVNATFANTVSASLTQAGISVTVDPKSTAETMAALQAGTFELARLGWGASGTNDPYWFWYEIFVDNAGTDVNYSGFDNTTLKTKLEAIKTAHDNQDLDAYLAAVADTNNYLVTETPIIPLLSY